MTSMLETPEWIAALSREDRNRIDNGIHPDLDTWKLRKLRAEYLSVAYDLRQEDVEHPSPATSELAAQLLARIELIDERIDRITQRKAEWAAWRPHNRECIHGVIGCSKCRPRQLSAEATYDRLRSKYSPIDERLLCGHGYSDPCPVCEGEIPADGECEL